MRYIITIFVLLLSFNVAISAKSKKNPSQSVTLYMYGLSTSFNDSTVYITDVMAVDSAYLQNRKFLGGAREYADQMNAYFSKKDMGRRTNAVFFKKTRVKAEKAYVKLKKRYVKNGIELQAIPTGDFNFKAVRPDTE